MKKIHLLSLILLLPLLGMSQEKWEGGLFLGYSNYLGDLVEPSFTFKQPSLAVGALVRHNLTNSLGLRLNLFYGKVKGDDLNYDINKDVGRKFNSSLVELSLLGEYEFFGNQRWDGNGKFSKVFSPYVFGGLGLAFTNPKDIPSGVGDPTSNYSNTHFALPLGVGIKYDLSRKVNLGLELGMRFTFDDYLDGISEVRGNPKDNDVYNFGGLVLTYRFGDRDTDGDGIVDSEDKCPTQPGPAALGGCPDTDGDGIADKDDACPNEPGEARLNGCPDRDGDGIPDHLDDCPDEPGLRRFAGCPDTDGDGIIDKEDDCPTVAGLAALNGCPDADRDGITDAEDDCPNEPGPAEHRGCPDTDNDGIPDKDDECPTQPGPRQFNGCPDTDGDGIADPYDKCPTLAGPASNSGCPEIKAEDKAVLDLAMRNVQFETASSNLLSSSKGVLNQIAEIIQRYPGYKLSIDGYTDSVGNDFANQQLSERRAQACYDYLASRGVSKSLMSYIGHGENNPIADNNTAEGRAKNRRVVFTLQPR